MECKESQLTSQMVKNLTPSYWFHPPIEHEVVVLATVIVILKIKMAKNWWVLLIRKFLATRTTGWNIL